MIHAAIRPGAAGAAVRVVAAKEIALNSMVSKINPCDEGTALLKKKRKIFYLSGGYYYYYYYYY
jgi:hypothetical protein